MSKPVYRCTFSDELPVQTIAAGSTITVELPDSDGLGPDLQPLPPELFATADRANPVYGPIAVEGAQPGDTLKISFDQITSNRRIARTLSAPDHGFLPDAFLHQTAPQPLAEKPHHLYHWELENGFARLANPLGDKAVVIPSRPFLGCLATASASPLSSLLAGSQGGNLDHPDLVAGTTLWLPVTLPGGLLYLGDMHAAQGHGETAGGGLEISGTATVCLTTCPALSLGTPRYQTPQGSACLAVSPSVDASMRLALASLIHWVAAEGWHHSDAAMLVQQTCQFRFGGLTDQYAVVSCFLDHSTFRPSLP